MPFLLALLSLTYPHPQLASPSIFEAPTKALSCIIPAYNEQDRLSTTLDEALK